MNQEKKTVWKLELIWWLFTAIAVIAIMLPIFLQVPQFPFMGYNILYIIIAITYTRYIFLLKHTPLAWNIPFKIVVPCVTAIAILLLVDGLSEFQRILDEEGYLFFLGHIPGGQAQSLATYIRSEYFFFGVASVICSIFLPIRMIISIWRQKNRGTV